MRLHFKPGEPVVEDGEGVGVGEGQARLRPGLPDPGPPFSRSQLYFLSLLEKNCGREEVIKTKVDLVSFPARILQIRECLFESISDIISGQVEFPLKALILQCIFPSCPFFTDVVSGVDSLPFFSFLETLAR